MHLVKILRLRYRKCFASTLVFIVRRIVCAKFANRVGGVLRYLERHGIY